MQTSRPDLRPLVSDLSTCHLIVDPPASGAWNMAVDEALLAAAADEGTATLRLYQWIEPTLSLGYFQRYEDRQQHAASLASAVVRRSSGGGAILHDRELTYSLALPERLVPDPHRLYLQVHGALVEVLSQLAGGQLGDRTLRICEQDAASPADGEPFLCFERRARGDVLLKCPTNMAGSSRDSADGTAAEPADWKLVGSAQRRRRGAILQHGSLLLGRSNAAPELPGLSDLTGAAAELGPLVAAVAAAIGAALGFAMQETELPRAIRAAARPIEASKYATGQWTKRR